MRARLLERIPGWKYFHTLVAGNSKTSEALRNIAWLFTERGVQLALSLTIGVWVARYLGPEHFGQLSLAIAFVSIVGPLSSLGLNSIITRDLVQKPDDADVTLGTALGLRLAGGALTLVLVAGFAWILFPSDSSLFLFAVIMSIGNVFQAFLVIDFWFQARVRSKHSVIAKSSALMVSALLKGTSILLEAPLHIIVIITAGDFILVAAGLLSAYLIQVRGVSWHFSRTKAATLLRQSWPLVLSGLGAAVYLKLDQLMLGHWQGDAAVGLYAIASRLSEVWYFIPVAVATSTFPALLNYKATNEALYRSRLQRLYNLLFGTALLVALPITLVARPLISAMYGEAYRDAGALLAVHIWASPFIFMRAALSKWLVAENLFKFALFTQAGGAVTNILLNAVLIPSSGGLGAAIATVVSYSAASYLVLFFHPKTRGPARMMSNAMLTPVLILWRRLRRTEE